MMANNHLPSMATPEATIPQANAHIGGNQVMGLNNSVTAESWGNAIRSVFTHDTFECQVKFTRPMVSTESAVGKAHQGNGSN
jgi:hypothetical protein